jgi:hypothetical protein
MALTEHVDGSVWIGANDQDAEGMFRWANGAALEFAEWLADQPNDLGGNEDCAELLPFGGSDVPCAGRWRGRPSVNDAAGLCAAAWMIDASAR